MFFDLLDNTLAFVSIKFRGVTNCKGEWWFHLDFKLLAINFLHALHLPEGDNVTIVKSVPFILMDGDKSFYILTDAWYNRLTRLLAIRIKDYVFVSKVNKSEAIEAEETSIDEASLWMLLATKIIDFDELFAVLEIGEDK